MRFSWSVSEADLTRLHCCCITTWPESISCRSGDQRNLRRCVKKLNVKFTAWRGVTSGQYVLSTRWCLLQDCCVAPLPATFFLIKHAPSPGSDTTYYNMTSCWFLVISYHIISYINKNKKLLPALMAMGVSSVPRHILRSPDSKYSYFCSKLLEFLGA